MYMFKFIELIYSLIFLSYLPTKEGPRIPYRIRAQKKAERRKLFEEKFKEKREREEAEGRENYDSSKKSWKEHKQHIQDKYTRYDEEY